MVITITVQDLLYPEFGVHAQKFRHLHRGNVSSLHRKSSHYHEHIIMRRISRIYEPFSDAAIGGFPAQRSSRYVCRTCLRRRTATQLPSSSSRFSTSAQRAGVLDSFKSVGDRLTGKKSMSDDAQKEVTESKDDSYTPADTWDGLEWVGTKQWHENKKRPQRAFEGYICVSLQCSMGH